MIYWHRKSLAYCV